jgi:hypothetical protein
VGVRLQEEKQCNIPKFDFKIPCGGLIEKNCIKHAALCCNFFVHLFCSNKSNLTITDSNYIAELFIFDFCV